MSSQNYDLIVVGGGPAGYAAALRAAGQKAKIAVVEMDLMGGTCLNRGCIPTKCFCHSAKVYSRLKNKSLPEIEYSGLNLNYSKMLQRKNEVVLSLRSGLEDLMKRQSIKIFKGKASVDSADTVSIVSGIDGGQKIKTSNVLVATGSSPVKLPGIPSDPRIHTTDSLWGIENLPKRLLIIGGGVIGIEAATIYKEICENVTVVEMLPEILSTVKKSFARIVGKSLKNSGVEIITGKKLSNLECGSNIEATLEGESEKRIFDMVLIAIGRKPNSKELFADELKIEMEKNFIKVEEDMQTSVKGIYAAGDVTGRSMLAHGASRMGIVAVNRAMGFDKNDTVDWGKIPDVIFSDPEIAIVGEMPPGIPKKDSGISIGRFPYITASKSQCDGETDGFAEIVYDKKSRKIIGGGLVGSQASDLLGEIILAVNSGMDPEMIEKSIHPHPTMTEIIWEASADTIGKALYKVRR